MCGSEDALESVMFPVREVDVLVESEPGRLARVRRSKALVNEWSGEVVSIIGNRYQVLHNGTALELAVSACAATFPETDPAAWKVTRVRAPQTGAAAGRRSVRWCTTWSFASSNIERYEPFFQMVTGYNGRIAFSLRFRVIRLVCENGLIGFESNRAHECRPRPQGHGGLDRDCDSGGRFQTASAPNQGTAWPSTSGSCPPREGCDERTDLAKPHLPAHPRRDLGAAVGWVRRRAREAASAHHDTITISPSSATLLAIDDDVQLTDGGQPPQRRVHDALLHLHASEPEGAEGMMASSDEIVEPDLPCGPNHHREQPPGDLRFDSMK